MLFYVFVSLNLLLKVVKRTEEYKESVLTAAAAHLEEWRTKVKKMKAIYYTLNLCNTDITQKLIVAEIWCAVSDLNKVQAALIEASVSYAVLST